MTEIADFGPRSGGCVPLPVLSRLRLSTVSGDPSLGILCQRRLFIALFGLVFNSFSGKPELKAVPRRVGCAKPKEKPPRHGVMGGTAQLRVHCR